MTAMEIMTGTEDASIAKREQRKALVRSALIILAIAVAASLPGWWPGHIYGGPDPRSAAARMAVEYAAQRLKAGEIPLWNPNVGLGEPLLGNGTSGVFFPTVLLHVVMPTKWAWVASAILMNWLAGFGVAVLVIKKAAFAVRSGSHSEPYGALVAAVLFMLGMLCLDFVQVSAMNVLALLPWALLASGALLERTSAPRVVGLTLLFLLIFLGGHETTSLGAILACMLYLILNFARRPTEWARPAGAILGVVAAAGVAALVAAVQWMPRRYYSSMEGVNGFALAHRMMKWFVLAPLVMLALALGVAWFADHRRGFFGKFFLLAGMAALVGLSLLLRTSIPPDHDMAEAAKWVQAQNDSQSSRLLAAGNKAWQIKGNALAAGTGQSERMRQWLRSVERIDKNELTLSNANHPALRLLASKYLISGSSVEPTTQPATAPIPTRRLFGRAAPTMMGKMDWKPIWPTTRPSGGVTVYENVSQPLPRFWMARSAEWSDKAQEVIERLAKSTEQLEFDPHEVVLLDREGEAESESGMFRRPPMGRGIGRLELLEDSPERVRIETQGAGGWLVLADAYAPGWTAKMSYTAVSRAARRAPRERTYERELAIVPAYGAMRAVALVGGTEVIFEYEPAGWKKGLMVAGIGSIVLLLMIGGMLFPSAEATGETPVVRN